MKLELLLLGVLLEHPRTGYELKKYFDTTGRFLRSNTQMSQVYRSLAAMEERGWVAYTVTPRPGAQDAKTYRPTEEGITVFLDWIDAPYAPPSRFQDPDFLALLNFAGFMRREQLLGLINTELETRKSEIARFRFRDRSDELEPPIAFDQAAARALSEWSHSYGAAMMDLHIEMLERLRADLLGNQIAGEPSPDPRQSSGRSTNNRD